MILTHAQKGTHHKKASSVCHLTLQTGITSEGTSCFSDPTQVGCSLFLPWSFTSRMHLLLRVLIVLFPVHFPPLSFVLRAGYLVSSGGSSLDSNKQVVDLGSVPQHQMPGAPFTGLVLLRALLTIASPTIFMREVGVRSTAQEGREGLRHCI